MDKDLLLAGGPHILTVADIRNTLEGIQANLSTLQDYIECISGGNKDTDAAFREIREELQKLGQYDNVKE